MQCKNCDKAFDLSYIPQGAPLLCTYCGFDNSGYVSSSQGDTFVTEPPAPSPVPVLTAPERVYEPQGGASNFDLRVLSDWEAGWKVSPFKAYVDTFKKVVLKPTTYFATITPMKDYAAVFVLLYVNFFISLFAGVLWGQLFNFSIFKFIVQNPELLHETTTLIPQLCGAFFGPLIMIVVMFIMAGIQHFFLKTIAGSKKDFDATITVYTLGSVVHVFAIIPLLGGLAAFFYQTILTIFGMADMHEVPLPKAFLAWVFPILICCCCYFGAIMFFVSIMAGLASAHG
jgi:hypothetical protein